MITINEESGMVTVVNVFTVEPEQQQPLIDYLIEDKDLPFSLPGCLSFSIHKSLDGKSVLNYVQWSSQEALKAASKEAHFAAGKKEIFQLSKDFNNSFYEVAFTAEAPSLVDA